MLDLREIACAPLTGLSHSRATRFWVRMLVWISRGRVIEVRGIEHILPSAGPFILACNHSQRLEAILLPAILAWCREGRLVHFFTDWLVMLYPVIGRVVLLHDPIVVTRKNAKVAWFNRFKSRYAGQEAPFDKAVRLLNQGAPVAIFPEGTMNRDRNRLLRGLPGAAQLSIQSQVAVVPAGIRFERSIGPHPIGDWERMTIEFGPPISPPLPRPAEAPSQIAEIRDWHARIMQAISRLSGKHWSAENQRTRYVT